MEHKTIQDAKTRLLIVESVEGSYDLLNSVLLEAVRQGLGIGFWTSNFFNFRSSAFRAKSIGICSSYLDCAFLKKGVVERRSLHLPKSLVNQGIMELF